MAERIGEILLKKELINQEQLETALYEQTQTGEFLGQILIRLGYVTEEKLLTVLAEQFNTRFVSLNQVRVDPTVLKLVPRSLAWEYKFMPLVMRNQVLLIAVSNPLDMWPMSVLQEKYSLAEVQIVLATRGDIIANIEKYYKESGS